RSPDRQQQEHADQAELEVEPDPRARDLVALVAVRVVLEDALLGPEAEPEAGPLVALPDREAPRPEPPARAEDRPLVGVAAVAELLRELARAARRRARCGGRRGRGRSRLRRRRTSLRLREHDDDREDGRRGD